MKRFLIILALVFGLPAPAFSQDISGVYKGVQGTVGAITIKKADNLHVYKVKPKYEDKYNMGFQGEFYSTPDRLGKAKDRFTDTGKVPNDAYLVSFDMGKNPDCRLTWKNEPGQLDRGTLYYRDIDNDKWFTLTINGNDLSLDMSMRWVRDHDGQCMSTERFEKVK